MTALRRFAAEVAVDLGSSNTRVWMRGQPNMVDAPTVVATQAGPHGREVVATGEEARGMLGRAPADTEVVRPVRGGVIADFEATEQLLRTLIRTASSRSLLRPRILVCIPSGTTEVERRAVQECARAAGGREVIPVVTSIAAAIGADLPVTEPVGSLIVDIGGGRTGVAVTSLGGVVVGRSVRVGGDAMDEAITHHLRQRHNLVIGPRTAEAIKLEIGGATPNDGEMRVRGRDMGAGFPREVSLTGEEVAGALAEPITRIRQTVLDTLRETPPELSADIATHGLFLCGGASLLPGLDEVLREATGLPVLRPAEPLLCVINGASKLMHDVLMLHRVTETT